MNHGYLAIIRLLPICFILQSYSQTFTEVSLTAGVNHYVYVPAQVGGGVAIFDYNNDGWEDIYISGGLRRDFLYHNNGDGTFTEVGLQAGLGLTGNRYTVGIVTGDINNDGFRDLFVVTMDQTLPNILYQNNGNGTFTDISQAAGITHSVRSASATMGDYNLDGYLDIYVANYVNISGFIRNANNVIIGYSHTGYNDFLYRNNGDGTFTQVAQPMSLSNTGTALAAAFTDYDNDSDMDIFAVNDFGEWVTPNKLYRNNYPTNSFTEVSAAAGANQAIYGMGIAIGDYDEDGDLDYYMTNIGPNVLLRNNGNGTFTNVATAAGVAHGYVGQDFSAGWGAAFLDYDNDTRLDLYVSDGDLTTIDIIPTGEFDPNKLFRNNGNGTFTDVSAQAGVDDSSMCRGLAIGDLDNDGDLDMVVVAIELDTFFLKGNRTLIYRNNLSNGNRWLKVKTQGTVNNRDGYGARVEVYAGGRKWIREIDGGSSFASQNSSIAHFGLGSYPSVDSIMVIWPGGNRQHVPNNVVNRQITVIENGPYQVFRQIDTTICADSVLIAGSWKKTSGIYRDTLGIPGVFDSIIVTDLIIFPGYVHHQSFSACLGDSIYAGGAWQFASGSFHDSLTTSDGCDSVIITTVNIPAITNRNIAICENDSFYVSGAFQHQPGVYHDTFLTVIGCDSVIITQLEKVEFHSTLLEYSLCDNDSFFAGGAYQTQAGDYHDTLQSSGSCDSVITTRLQYFTSVFTSIASAICQGDSLLIGNVFRTQTGIYRDSLLSTAGCDSIIEIALAVYPVYEENRQIEINAGDSFFAGNAWQSVPGAYLDTFVTLAGCDSIIITELSVASGIAGTAPCIHFLKAHPNPFENSLSVSFCNPQAGESEFALISVTGKIHAGLIETHAEGGVHIINIEQLSHLAKGIYFLRQRTNGSVGYLKLVKL